MSMTLTAISLANSLPSLSLPLPCDVHSLLASLPLHSPLSNSSSSRLCTACYFTCLLLFSFYLYTITHLNKIRGTASTNSTTHSVPAYTAYFERLGRLQGDTWLCLHLQLVHGVSRSSQQISEPVQPLPSPLCRLELTRCRCSLTLRTSTQDATAVQRSAVPRNIVGSHREVQLFFPQRSS